MGCLYSKENRCYSLTCCFCMKSKAACYWIGGVGLVWGGFATCFDYVNAYLPFDCRYRCLDPKLNADLSFANGVIDSVQWVMSLLLIHGARKEVRILVLLWLIWSVVSLGMQLLWTLITLPYTPTIRGFASIFQLVWGIHYFIVIKTHYTRMVLTFTPPEEPLKPVPPNTPCRKHKRRKRRVDPNSHPPIRLLLGAAIKLNHEKYKRRVLADLDPDSEEEVIVVSNMNDDNSFSDQEIPSGREGRAGSECRDEPKGRQRRCGDNHNPEAKGTVKGKNRRRKKRTDKGTKPREERTDENSKRTRQLHKIIINEDDRAGYVVMDIDVINTTKSASDKSEPQTSNGAVNQRDEANTKINITSDDDGGNVCLMPGGPQLSHTENTHDDLSNQRHHSKDTFYANENHPENSNHKSGPDDIEGTNSEGAFTGSRENICTRRISYKIAVGHDEWDMNNDARFHKEC